jgi:hypothetical protein
MHGSQINVKEERDMNLRIFLLIFLFIPFFIMCNIRDNKIHADNQITEEYIQIKGTEIITDESFKKDILAFFTFDEKSEDQKSFQYLSKRFLNKYYPNVNTAEDFKNELEKKDRGTPPHYLEILDYQIISTNERMVLLLLDYFSEGIWYKTKNNYFFVHEEGTWKFYRLELVE